MKRYLGLVMVIIALAIGTYSFRQWRFETAYNQYVSEKKTIPFRFSAAFPARSEFTLAYFNEIEGNLDEAANAYLRAFSASGETDTNALFNLGNVSIAMAFKKIDIMMIVAAIGYYKESLRLKPDFMEAKYNLEVAMRLLNSVRRQGVPSSGAGNSDGKRKKNGGASHVPFKAQDI